jgi:hypothetical protein
MKRILGGIAAAVFALTAVVVAQNFDGKWTGEVQGGRGPQTVTMTFKIESGGTLTGTVAGGRGGEVAIKEGKVSGNKITFKTTQMGRGGEINVSWSGTIKGDTPEIAMTRTVEGGQGQAQEFTLKRQQ